MTANGWLQIIVYLAVILTVTKPMGVFMARVFSRERTFLDPVLRPVERLLYRLTLVENTRCAGRNTPSPCCCSVASPCCCSI
jgi:potassium-transporting ATPase potassium-binding subunit